MIRWTLSALLAVGLLSQAATALAQAKSMVVGGRGEGSVYFFDPAALVTDGDLRRLVIYRPKRETPPIDGREVPYAVIQAEFNCKTRQVRLPLIQGLDTEFVKRAEFDQFKEWTKVSEGTPIGAMFDLACGPPEGLANAERIEGEPKTIMASMLDTLRKPAD